MGRRKIKQMTPEKKREALRKKIEPGWPAVLKTTFVQRTYRTDINAISNLTNQVEEKARVLNKIMQKFKTLINGRTNLFSIPKETIKNKFEQQFGVIIKETYASPEVIEFVDYILGIRALVGLPGFESKDKTDSITAFDIIHQRIDKPITDFPTNDKLPNGLLAPALIAQITKIIENKLIKKIEKIRHELTLTRNLAHVRERIYKELGGKTFKGSLSKFGIPITDPELQNHALVAHRNPTIHGAEIWCLLQLAKRQFVKTGRTFSSIAELRLALGKPSKASKRPRVELHDFEKSDNGHKRQKIDHIRPEDLNPQTGKNPRFFERHNETIPQSEGNTEFKHPVYPSSPPSAPTTTNIFPIILQNPEGETTPQTPNIEEEFNEDSFMNFGDEMELEDTTGLGEQGQSYEQFQFQGPNPEGTQLPQVTDDDQISFFGRSSDGGINDLDDIGDGFDPNRW